MGAHTPRGRADTGGMRARGRSKNLGGGDEGTQKEHQSKSKGMSGWAPNAVVNARNTTMILKVGGTRSNCHERS